MSPATTIYPHIVKLIPPTENCSVQCEICHKALLIKSSYCLNTKNEELYICGECYKMFSGKRKSKTDVRGLKDRLEMHMLTDKPSECEICHKKFSSNASMKKHLVTHANVKPHECENCHKKFSQKHSLKLHMLKHTKETPHECKVCHKMFSIKANMKKHMQAHIKKGLIFIK